MLDALGSPHTARIGSCAGCYETPHRTSSEVDVGSIAWDPALETGDALVDEQHRNIHAVVADLEAAGDDVDAIMGVLERLMAHVDTHFATEEDLMRREGFPGDQAEGHIAEHRKLTDGARDIVLGFRSGEITRGAPIVAFLCEWLTDHVHQKDRVLVDWVRARGAAARRLDESAPDAPKACSAG
jgi:hemerythrin-like metal-binding protein